MVRHIPGLVVVLGLHAACATSQPVTPPEPSSAARPRPDKGWVESNTVSRADDTLAGKDGIREVVRRNMPAVSACYIRALAHEPALRGNLVIRFVIGQDGTVHTAAVKSSSGLNDELEDCVVGEFGRFVFEKPQSADDVSVSYPLVFEPPRGIDSSDPTYRRTIALRRSVLVDHVDSCFSSRARRREPVFVRCRVASDGGVSDVEVFGLPPASHGLERCIQRRVRETQLPGHDSSTPIDVTVEL